jgi:hypothetical protein
VATGAWISTLFVMTYIKAELDQQASLQAITSLTNRLQGKLFMLAVFCLGIVIITGIIRGFTFRYYGWTGDVAKGRKRLLMVKHFIIGTVVLIGLYYQFILWG